MSLIRSFLSRPENIALPPYKKEKRLGLVFSAEKRYYSVLSEISI